MYSIVYEIWQFKDHQFASQVSSTENVPDKGSLNVCSEVVIQIVTLASLELVQSVAGDSNREAVSTYSRRRWNSAASHSSSHASLSQPSSSCSTRMAWLGDLSRRRPTDDMDTASDAHGYTWACPHNTSAHPSISASLCHANTKSSADLYCAMLVSE